MISWEMQCKFSKEIIFWTTKKFALSYCMSDDCDDINKIRFIDSIGGESYSSLIVYVYYADEKYVTIDSESIRDYDFDYIFCCAYKDAEAKVYCIEKNTLFNEFVERSQEDDYYSGQLDVILDIQDEKLQKYIELSFTIN